MVCFPSNVLRSVGAPYDSAYPPIWTRLGEYDFDCLDRQVADKLAVNPKAKFLSPGSYHDRQIGGASGFMVPLASIQHHGKGFLMSMDHRTPAARSVILGKQIPGHEGGFTDEAACIAGLRREFSLRLISGISTHRGLQRPRCR